MLALVACSALLVAGLDGPTPPDAAQSYQEAKAQAGRSPEGQVRLALWCEAHGLNAQRLHHLTLAVLADPANVAARGLMGLVAHDGRWRRPEDLADKLKADPGRAATLAEYASKRVKAAYTADAQWALGVWCEEHGLKEQARAHLTAVVRLDPKRENAWRKLGYKKHEGQWVTDAQLAAEKAESEAQKQADKTWRPLLDRYRSMLDRPTDRAEAESALAEVTDPRAVPAILHTFVRGRVADQLRAVQLLGQVNSPAASRSLAALAVLAKSAEVRRAAIETLKGRDPRDFVRLWIALIRQPIKYEVKPVGGPGSPGTLFVEGERANLRRLYSPPGMPNVPIERGARLSYDNNGLPVLTEPTGVIQEVGRVVWLPYYSYDTPQLLGAITQATHGGNLQQILGKQAQAGRPAQSIAGYFPYAFSNGEIVPLNGFLNNATLRPGARLEQEANLRVPIGQMAIEAEKSARTAQEQLAGDVAVLEKLNTAIRRSNEPAVQALRAITGQDYGDDPVAWGKWSTDQEGYAYAITGTTDKPTIVEDVPLGYTPLTVPQVVGGRVVSHHACFAAGTTVRTIEGDRAIESIEPGDLVLVQDTKTGALGYQGVVAVFHNPPNSTLRVDLGSEAVVATGIHRFWKASQGWTMARDLKPGDLVRTLGGAARVEGVADDRVRPVFNLEVGEGHSFLVGKLGALVHDNSLVEATPDPFDGLTTPTPAVAKVGR